MKLTRSPKSLSLLLLLGLAASCTKDGPLEEAGETVDEAVEDTADAIDDAVDD